MVRLQSVSIYNVFPFPQFFSNCEVFTFLSLGNEIILGGFRDVVPDKEVNVSNDSEILVTHIFRSLQNLRYLVITPHL